MSKGDTTENDVMKIMFTKTYDPTWRTNSNLYLSLHNDDPGEGGDQTTNETAYTGYHRVPVTKDSAGWTITNNQAQNFALAQFPQCGASGDTITHVAIGTVADPGAGQILYSGELNAPLIVSNLIQPQFAALALTITED